VKKSLSLKVGWEWGSKRRGRTVLKASKMKACGDNAAAGGDRGGTGYGHTLGLDGRERT